MTIKPPNCRSHPLLVRSARHSHDSDNNLQKCCLIAICSIAIRTLTIPNPKTSILVSERLSTMFSEASSTAERSSSCQSFTISQVAPSALLQFEPPLHSKELAEAIHNYVPGPFTLQEKQRQVSMEFFQWRSTNCPDGPASYFHDAAPAMEFSNFSSAESSFDYSMASSSGQTSFGNNTKSSAPARRTKSKVVKKSSAKPVSSGPRLPGLSIMTKDGVDITDLAPRGPKTKEQRDHAAMMRKLKACPTCKKRKQRVSLILLSDSYVVFAGKPSLYFGTSCLT